MPELGYEAAMPVEGLPLGEDVLWPGQSTHRVPARLTTGGADR